MSLKAFPPPLGVARVRFVATNDDLISDAIRFDSRGAVSHVEAILPGDGGIIAALHKTGVTRLPLDYDGTSTTQIVVDIHMPPEMIRKWEDFLVSKIGTPYDTEALFGFLFFLNFHKRNSLICSALITDALRHCGFFPVKLAQRYFQINPVVNLLMLQAQPFERVTIHPVETI